LNLESRVAGDARDEIRRDIGDDVRLATPEGGHAGGRVGNQPKGERVDGGRAAPVFMVRGERHPVVFDPRLETVRAGPDRVRCDITGAARLIVAGRRDPQQHQSGQEQRQWIDGRDLNGVRIYDADVLYAVHEIVRGGVLQER